MRVASGEGVAVAARAFFIKISSSSPDFLKYSIGVVQRSVSMSICASE